MNFCSIPRTIAALAVVCLTTVLSSQDLDLYSCTDETECRDILEIAETQCPKCTDVHLRAYTAMLQMAGRYQPPHYVFQDSNGRNLLWWAAFYGDPCYVKALLAQQPFRRLTKQSAAMWDNAYCTPLHAVVLGMEVSEPKDPTPRFEKLYALLTNAGANPGCIYEGQTARQRFEQALSPKEAPCPSTVSKSDDAIVRPDPSQDSVSSSEKLRRAIRMSLALQKPSGDERLAKAPPSAPGVIFDPDELEHAIHMSIEENRDDDDAWRESDFESNSTGVPSEGNRSSATNGL